MAPTLSMGLLDSLVAMRLWDATKATFRAFISPSLPSVLPPEHVPDILMGVLTFGVFLVVAGTAFAVRGKGKFWKTLAFAAGAAVAGWVFFGRAVEVPTFFVVVLLVLKFLGGVTFVLGLFRSVWVPAAILLSIMLAATGTVDPDLVGTLLGIYASFLGALSLFRKAEEFSPGRKGSTWNRRTAVGWVACLLAAGLMTRSGGLGAYAVHFKTAGMIVGAAILVLMPSMFGAGVRVRLTRTRR